MAIPRHDWYLVDWMATQRLTQADMIRKTGWDRRKASFLFNGEQRYNRETMNEAAMALNCEPFELLLPPADAMRVRRVLGEIYAVAAETRSDFRGEESDLPQTGTEG